MSLTDAQFNAWLKDQKAIRCILVEVGVKSGGVEQTRYLSNRGYTTSPTDSPANTTYAARIVGGVKFTEEMSLDGSVSVSYGDIELNNLDGALDTWIDDYWSNRSLKIFIGDVMWPRDDFRQVFGGVVSGIDARNRDRVNLKISDKLQRLNTPVSEVKLGGSSVNADNLIPLCFGECHNVEPLLVDAALHQYQVHNGPIERIIEVRDNGVPVAYTADLTTGKFTLVNQPVGQITASVQGGKYGANWFRYTEDFSNAAWSKTGLSLGSGPALNPAGATATKLVQSLDASAANHGLGQSLSAMTLTTGDYIVSSVYLKAAEHQFVQIRWFGGAAGISSRYANFDVLTGAVYNTCHSAFTVDVGGGWFYCCAIEQVQGTAASRDIGIELVPSLTATRRQTFVGNGVNGVYIYGPQQLKGAIPLPYSQQGASLAQPYPNTVSHLTYTLATQYGNLKIADADFDAKAWAKFMLQNQQPVGVYLKDRANVLDVCNQLASSIGARLVASRTGLASLVKLDLSSLSSARTVTADDIAERSLEIEQLPAVKAAVKLGYCKNFTVQDNLAAGVIEEHAKLFKEEWLTITRSDTAAAANYNLFTEPTQEDTLLLTNADAITESLRRLNLFSTQRKVIRYKGYPWLLFTDLGSAQTLQHPRFGLSSGKVGQVISIASDYINMRLEVRVLI